MGPSQLAWAISPALGSCMLHIYFYRCGGDFKDHFIAYFWLNVPVKEFWSQSVFDEVLKFCGLLFMDHPVCFILYRYCFFFAYDFCTLNVSVFSLSVVSDAQILSWMQLHWYSVQLLHQAGLELFSAIVVSVGYCIFGSNLDWIGFCLMHAWNEMGSDAVC